VVEKGEGIAPCRHSGSGRPCGSLTRMELVVAAVGAQERWEEGLEKVVVAVVDSPLPLVLRQLGGPLGSSGKELG